MGRGVKKAGWDAGELVQVLAASGQDVPQAVHDLAMKHSRFRKAQPSGKGKGAGRGRKAQVRVCLPSLWSSMHKPCSAAFRLPITSAMHEGFLAGVLLPS